MKIKDGFTLRTMLGENIVVGEGLSQVNFNKLISLNETAAFLWKEVQGKTFGKEDLVKLLLDNYEVEEERAAADVDKLIDTWIKEGIIEE
ncbi:MAG: PqqD family protein [Bacteroidales bacterium]|nr:PqqD family protein [Bacteroidales bacterium]